MVAGRPQDNESARILRKRAAEAEAERQSAMSRELSYEESLASLQAEYAESGKMAIFFKKIENPSQMIVRGKPVSYGSKNPNRETVFDLPLDGALGNMTRVMQYESKGWPIVGSANLPFAKPPTEELKQVFAHVKMVLGMYAKMYGGAPTEPKLSGMEKKLASEGNQAHEVILPVTREKTKASEDILRKLEEELDEEPDQRVIVEAFDSQGEKLK